MMISRGEDTLLVCVIKFRFRKMNTITSSSSCNNMKGILLSVVIINGAKI